MSPSPTGFKSQILALLASLRQCDALCEAIRENRRLSTTANLDRLQAALLTSLRTIESSYASWRRVIGSRMDTGDDLARHALASCSRDLEDTVMRKLRDVATNRVRERGEREVPGFGELWRRWCVIEKSVVSAIDALGERFDSAPPTPTTLSRPLVRASTYTYTHPAPRPRSSSPASAPVRPALKADEIVITRKELAGFEDHLKNSWVERDLGQRRSCWVNVFNEDEIRWEKPESGYVRGLGRAEKKVRIVVDSDDEEGMYGHPRRMGREGEWRGEDW